MRHAFTIVELVVAMGIVLLLAGLTLSVSTVVVERSEVRRTETALRLLDLAVGEWEASADRRLTWWNLGDGDAYRETADVHADTADVLIITEILDVIRRHDGVREILARIDEASLLSYRAGEYPPWIDGGQERAQLDMRFDGGLTVLDAWGTPLYATHPGRPWDPADDAGGLHPDDDGTIHTYNETRYGTAPDRRIVFVSAGPDGRFGLPAEFLNLDGAARDEAIAAARKDNLYSVPVRFPAYE